MCIDRCMGKAAMNRMMILGAAAVLSMIAATPASAQFAQQEPAAFAASNPNANDRNTMASLPFGKTNAYLAKRHTTRAALSPPRSGIGHRL